MSDQIYINETSNPINILVNEQGSLVYSVNGMIGAVIITPSTIGLDQVNNTSDLNKPVSYATLSALLLKTDLSLYYTLNDLVTSRYKSWDSVYLTVSALSANWNSVYSNTKANSGSWGGAYSWVSQNSSNAVFNTISAISLSGIFYGDGSNLIGASLPGQLTINNLVSSNYNNWNTAYYTSTAYASNSGSFVTNSLLQSTSSLLVKNSDFTSYQTSVATATATLLPTTTYQNASGNFAQKSYVDGKFLPLSGGTLTGNLTINKNLILSGSAFFGTSSNFINLSGNASLNSVAFGKNYISVDNRNYYIGNFPAGILSPDGTAKFAYNNDPSITDYHLIINPDGSIKINNDGATQGGKINLISDGSASFAGGAAGFDIDGNFGAQYGGFSSYLNTNGISNNALDIDPDGNLSVGNGTVTIDDSQITIHNGDSNAYLFKDDGNGNPGLGIYDNNTRHYCNITFTNDVFDVSKGFDIGDKIYDGNGVFLGRKIYLNADGSAGFGSHMVNAAFGQERGFNAVIGNDGSFVSGVVYKDGDTVNWASVLNSNGVNVGGYSVEQSNGDRENHFKGSFNNAGELYFGGYSTQDYDNNYNQQWIGGLYHDGSASFANNKAKIFNDGSALFSNNKTRIKTDGSIRIGNPTLVNGIKAYWSFGSSDVNLGFSLADSTGNNYTLVNSGGSNVTRNENGKIGYAANFDGNAYLKNTSFPNLNTFTISVWVNPSDNIYHPVRLVTTVGSGAGICLEGYDYDRSSYNFSFRDGGYQDPDNEQIYNSSFYVPPNDWSHLVATYDVNGLNLYANGTNVGSFGMGFSFDFANNGGLSIGTCPATEPLGNGYNGSLDELGIYNRAFTPKEVTALYNKNAGLDYTAINNTIVYDNITLNPSGSASFATGAATIDINGNITANSIAVSGGNSIQWSNAYNKAVYTINGTANQIVATKTNSTPGNTTYTLSLPNSAFFPGSVSIAGNLTIAGSATYINTSNLVVGDNIIYFNDKNYGSNVLDMGIVSHFTQGPLGYQHTGLVRRAGQGYPGIWTLFSGLTTEPLTATNLDWNDKNIVIDSLNANIIGNLSGSYVTVGNGNSDQWNSAYTIGTAYQNASGSFVTNNTFGTYQTSVANTTATLLPTTTYQNASGSFALTNATNTFTASQIISSGNITTSRPALAVSQNWNNSGTTFTALCANIIDSGSSSGSLFLDFQKSGISAFSIDKNGGINNQNDIYAPTLYIRSRFGNNKPIALASLDSSTASAHMSYYGFCVSNTPIALSNSGVGTPGDVVLNRDAANTLALRNGLNPNTFRIYNTYTDANNYQRGALSYQNSALVIGTEYTTTAGNSALSGQANPIILAPGYNQSLSATAPISLQQTWNNPSNAFTLLSANVTDTASSASSLLMDLQVGGSSKFNVRKDGIAIGSSWVTSPQGFRVSTASDSSNQSVQINAAGISIPSGAYYAWTNASINYGQNDLLLYRDAANILALRNSTNSQAFRLYNSYTDVSNYQRGTLSYQNSALVIGTEYTTTAGNSALSGQANPIILAPGYNQSLSATAPVVVQQTWNNSSNAFTLLSANVTDTASSASSLLLDLQTNGTSRGQLTKAGKFLSNNYGFDGFSNRLTFWNGAASLGTMSTAVWNLNSSQILGWSSGTSDGNPDTRLYRDVANTIAQRNGTVSQTKRIYNTYTDTNNYERGTLTFSSPSSAFTIAAESAGTGGVRDIWFNAGGSTRVAITSSGNVGIGTTTPNTNLTVVGNISAQNLVYDGTGNSGNWNNTTTIVQSNSASSWRGSKTLARFRATENYPPATNFATLDTRNSIAVLNFDKSGITKSAVFLSNIPENSNLTNGLNTTLYWASTATSGAVTWQISYENMNGSIDTDSFTTTVSAAATTNSTSGIMAITTLSAANTSNLASGSPFRIKVSRVPSDSSDTMTATAQLVSLEVRSI